MNEPTPGMITSGATPEPATSSSAVPRNRPNQNRRRGGTNNITPSNHSNFDGSCSTLNCVLGMRIEKLQNKLPFHQFTEKIYYHIVAEYKDGSDMYPLFKHLKDPYTDLSSYMPIKGELDPDEDAAVVEAEREIYKEEIKQFVQRKLTLRRNIQKAYGLLWGQCSNQLQEYIKGLAQFEQESATSNTIWLLQELKKATSGVDSKANAWKNMQDSIATLYRMKQGPHESNEHYLDRFKANITAVELTKDNHIFYSPGLTGIEKSRAKPENIIKEEQRNKALLLLRNSDENRYKGLAEELRKSTILDRDEYPTTLANMYEVMAKYDRNTINTTHRPYNQRRSGTVLAQTNDTGENQQRSTIAGTDGRTHADIKCFNCDNMGHYASNCPNPQRRPGFNSLIYGYIMTQKQNKSTIIPSDWILLDSCSTDCVFKDPSIVSNIVKCAPEDELEMRTNGGSVTYKHTGHFKYLPLKVYFNNKSIANILSLKHVMSIPGAEIKMENGPNPSFLLNIKDKQIRFTGEGGGLFHCSISDLANPTQITHKNHTNNAETPNLCFTTVRENEASYSKKDKEKARMARNLQRNLLWPSNEALIRHIESGQIKECNISKSDILRADDIYGPATASLHGKLCKPKQVKNTSSQLPLPENLPNDSMRIKLYIDIFYVDGIPFLHTKSKDVNYITIQHLADRKEQTLVMKLSYVSNLYLKRGFTITDVFSDNEFSELSIKQLFLPANMHICARGEHVPIIERSIRTVKERARAVYNDLPYGHIPTIMMISLMNRISSVLNAFQPKDSTLQQSPLTLVEGRGPINYNDYPIPFGAYTIAYGGTDNTMDARGIPAVALHKSNDSNGFYFMSLITGRRINCNKWTTLPIPDDVIERVENMANKERKLKTSEHEFQNLNLEEEFIEQATANTVEVIHANMNQELDTNEENMNTLSTEIEPVVNTQEESTVTNPVVNTETRNATKHDNNSDINSDMFEFNINNAYDSSWNDDSESEYNDETSTPDKDEPDNTKNDDSSSEDSEIDVPISELIAKYGRKGTHDSPHSSISSNNIVLCETSTPGEEEVSSDDEEVSYHTVVNQVFTQMSAQQGIKKHGERAIAAIFKELKQLNDGVMPGKPVIAPIPFEELTEENKRQALGAVNLIKEKRCGKLKGRTCANGSKQRSFLKDGEDFASPTASLESILTTLVIDAWEKRDVAVADVPGAYLHASFPEDKRVILKLQGTFVDIMCEVNPKFEEDIIYEKTKRNKLVKCLYVRVLRALYGCIESALLWYDLYSSTLQDMGFDINPYDRCVANKMINGSQCTIVFYVDDNKVSHKDPQVVTDVLNIISEHFGELSISRGNKHDFLGMNIELRDQKVFVDMQEQVQEAINWGNSQGGCKPPNPATGQLFTRDPKSDPLSTKDSDLFHSIVQKLLYICKRARPDIEPAISYLCTRVTSPTKEDDIKLTRILGFLEKTIDDKRVMGATSLNNLYTWVDASYGVHSDMKSHTGGNMSFGIGTIHTKSSKQKLNTKSSTEAELVGVSEYLPHNIWLMNFLEKQGYKPENNVLFQDNQSAMRMEINGRNSCTGNSRHIDIRYFFVKDRVDTGEIKIEYCPTEHMVADFFTKPVQGTLFKSFRNQVMGYTPITFPPGYLPKIKERVEDPFVEDTKIDK